MKKKDEISNPSSCLNKAKDDELIFVLLARDKAAVKAVRTWCEERLRLKKNNVGDQQIREAFDWAATVESQLHSETTPS